MAYTPKTWVCGETITDAGLNNIEEGIQEALAGGGSSLPEVTSADDDKVLTVVDGKWEKADKDFVCEENRSTFIDTSITTTSSGMTAKGNFPNGTPFPFEVGQTVFVTFNGTEHELVVRKSAPDAPVSELLIGNLGIDGFEIAYGINTPSDPPVLRTMLASTYTVKIETLEITATTTDCFEAAVNSVVKLGYKCDGDDVETSECFEKAVKSVVDAGYECKETYSTLLEESVTTVEDQWGENGAELAYSNHIDAPKIRVVFNGVEYDCEEIRYGATDSFYGGITESLDADFSEYPFYISSAFNAETSSYSNFIVTETAGTYDVKIEIPALSATTTECFRTAVKSVVGDSGPLYVNFDHKDDSYSYFDKTWQQVRDALYAGRTVIVIPESDGSIDDILTINEVYGYADLDDYRAYTRREPDYVLYANSSNDVLYVGNV